MRIPPVLDPDLALALRATEPAGPPSMPGHTIHCVAPRALTGDAWAPVAAYALEYDWTATGRPCIPPPAPSGEVGP